MIDTDKYAIRDAILKHSRDGVIELLREEVKRLRKRLNQIKNIAKGAIE